jgi:2-hydroxychromene-2-carboxylate isomerase
MASRVVAGEMKMGRVSWYFDFISPYAYFGLHTLERLGVAEAEIDYQPVLLAALLNHWGQKGPAEIPSKRIWTYRACIWWARQNNIPFRVPSPHPFNPLPYLRLCIAAGNSAQAIRTIFDGLWTSGVDPADPGAIASLAASLNVPLERITEPGVKSALRESTERAVQKGVFGVPTFAIDGHLFWGDDSVEFAAAYLRDPAIMQTREMKLIDTLPIGVSRT